MILSSTALSIPSLNSSKVRQASSKGLEDHRVTSLFLASPSFSVDRWSPEAITSTSVPAVFLEEPTLLPLIVAQSGRIDPQY